MSQKFKQSWVPWAALGVVKLADTIRFVGTYDSPLIQSLPEPHVGHTLSLIGLPDDLISKIAAHGWMRYGEIALRMSLAGHETGRTNSMTYRIEEIAADLPLGERPIFTLGTDDVSP